MDKLTQKFSFGFALSLTLGLAACGGGDEYEGFDASVTQSTPNRFLTFFNRLGQLPAGTYTLVVATAVPGRSGPFSVTVARNDGSATQLISGSWTNSGGPDSDPACGTGNRCYTIDFDDAKGATFSLTTAFAGVLYLVDNDGAAPQVVSTANATGPGAAVSLKFSKSEIDETAYATAYYAAIDPGNARDTAQKFIALHGLDGPDVVHVIFRDSKDLGYGRDMYMRRYPNTMGCGGDMIAFYVRNFSVEIVEGFAYGPVNLEAAIAADLRHHVGSNAIEFGLGRSDVGDTCGSEPMAKFYTYEPVYQPATAPHPRRLRVDLDARGSKAMPQPCISCHGGKLRPLDRFGRFVAIHANDSYAPSAYPPAAGAISDIGNTKARLQAFEIDTFEFSDQAGHRRIDYEDALREMNAAVYCTYPGSDSHPACNNHDFDADTVGGVGAQVDPGEWSGDFAREMMLGWYGDDGVNDALNNVGASFDGSFVPVGWTAGGGAPAGADVLFTGVVGPNCFVCHGKRGNELGSNSNSSPGGGKDVDFSSWDKFITHADEIERLVFDEGKMPLGLLNFQNFWGDPAKADMLASFIEPYVSDSAGFQSRRNDAAGNLIEPGTRVVARAGPDRVTKPGASISLNAQASLYADTYRWQIVSSPVGSTPVLSSAVGIRTEFNAVTTGEYQVQLTASSSESGSSRTDQLKILIVNDPMLKAPRDLTFYSDISTELADCASFCHTSGFIPGIPVWWVLDNNQPAGATTGVPAGPGEPPALGFYEQARARVNLEFIEDSLLLKKPSGRHHYGGATAISLGYDTSLDVGDAGRANYDKFVNWIAEGAPCGLVGPECP